MAGRDGRGPFGEGEMTGRGMGPCAGGSPRGAYGARGAYGSGRRSTRAHAGGRGAGFSRGNRCDRPIRRGCGLGYGAGYFQVGDISEEEFLKQEKGILEERLNEVSRLLED